MIQSIIFIINNPVSSSLLDSSYSIPLTLIQFLLVRSVEILNLFVLVALVEDLYVWFMCCGNGDCQSCFRIVIVMDKRDE